MVNFIYLVVTLANQNCMHVKRKWVKLKECFLPFTAQSFNSPVSI